MITFCHLHRVSHLVLYDGDSDKCPYRRIQEIEAAQDVVNLSGFHHILLCRVINVHSGILIYESSNAFTIAILS